MKFENGLLNEMRPLESIGMAWLQIEPMLWHNKLSFVHTSRKLMFEDFRDWLSKVSSIDLEPTIDMSCAKYEFTGKEDKDFKALTPQ